MTLYESSRDKAEVTSEIFAGGYLVCATDVR